MDYMSKYNEWLNYEGLDQDLRKQLVEMANDSSEIEDRF